MDKLDRKKDKTYVPRRIEERINNQYNRVCDKIELVAMESHEIKQAKREWANYVDEFTKQEKQKQKEMKKKGIDYKMDLESLKFKEVEANDGSPRSSDYDPDDLSLIEAYGSELDSEDSDDSEEEEDEEEEV